MRLKRDLDTTGCLKTVVSSLALSADLQRFETIRGECKNSIPKHSLDDEVMLSGINY